MEDESLDCGWFDCEEMIKKVAECKNSDNWPGCYDSLQGLAIRRWELGSNPEDDISELGLNFDSTE